MKRTFRSIKFTWEEAEKIAGQIADYQWQKISTKELDELQKLLYELV